MKTYFIFYEVHFSSTLSYICDKYFQIAVCVCVCVCCLFCFYCLILNFLQRVVVNIYFELMCEVSKGGHL